MPTVDPESPRFVIDRALDLLLQDPQADYGLAPSGVPGPLQVDTEMILAQLLRRNAGSKLPASTLIGPSVPPPNPAPFALSSLAALAALSRPLLGKPQDGPESVAAVV